MDSEMVSSLCAWTSMTSATCSSWVYAQCNIWCGRPWSGLAMSTSRFGSEEAEERGRSLTWAGVAGAVGQFPAPVVELSSSSAGTCSFRSLLPPFGPWRLAKSPESRAVEKASFLSHYITQWLHKQKQTPFWPQGVRHLVMTSWTMFSSTGMTRLNWSTPTQKSSRYVLRKPGCLIEFRLCVVLFPHWVHPVFTLLSL